MKIVFLVFLLVCSVAHADGDKELSQHIIDKCVGAKDTQECQAKYAKCLASHYGAIKQKHADCATMSGERKQECLSEAQRMEKSPYAVLTECTAK